MLSCAIGVAVGLVLRRRDVVEATARLESRARAASLELWFALDARSISRQPDRA